MNGRIENETKIDNSIDKKLKTMPEYVIKWHNVLIASDKTASTRRDYIYKVNAFLAFINKDVKHISPSEITDDVVVDYFKSIKIKNDKPTSDSFQIAVWSCLHSFLDFMVGKGLIKENYIDVLGIKKPKNHDLPRIDRDRILLTKKDFNKILQAVDDRHRRRRSVCYGDNLRRRDFAIMLIFMNTGMRKTALANIDIEDVDLDSSKLIVVDKGEIEHVYILAPMAKEALERYLSQREVLIECNNSKTHALFVNQYGQRMSGNALEKLVKKYCETALGKEISPHKLRSGFCSILYNETKDIEFVRRSVGHSKISTTQRYIVTEGRETEVASNIISNILK